MEVASRELVQEFTLEPSRSKFEDRTRHWSSLDERSRPSREGRGLILLGEVGWSERLEAGWSERLETGWSERVEMRAQK